MKQTHILPQMPEGITDSVVEKYLRDLQKVIRDKHEDDYMSSRKSGGVGADIASVSEAKAGVDNTKVITPYGLRQALNAEGSAPVYACRAWINFDGTTSPITIRASGNVSSITDGGVGIYIANFTTDMPDVNYATSFNNNTNGGSQADKGCRNFNLNSVRMNSIYNGALCDSNNCHLMVFR